MGKRKYTDKEIKLWANEYKKFHSFKKVSELFEVSARVIQKILERDREKFNIETRKSLSEKNLKRCSIKEGCGKIKSKDKFDSRGGIKKYILKNLCIVCDSKYFKNYRNNNKDKKNENERKLKKTDINYKLASILRTRLSSAIKNNQKVGSAVSDLGCSIPDLKLYLEAKFYSHLKTNEQMTWENYGLYGWHIDHIKPLASFDLTDREQFLKACHYTNLQPLWAEENLKKGAKYNNK